MVKRYTTVILLVLWATSIAAGQNIVLILTDDQGWSQSSPMDPQIASSKSSYLDTPNMATLMNRGMRFTSGYSPLRSVHRHVAAIFAERQQPGVVPSSKAIGCQRSI